MKFSKQWLAEWLPLPATDKLVTQLTMAGLEVDGVEPAASAFNGVVVGEVLSVAQHPNADKLKVCQVQGSAAPVQVVCGAPNVAAGLKVPFAEVGAVLPGDFKIKQAKLRGEPSQGMLCAAEELGLEDDCDGLMVLSADAPAGQNLRDYLLLDDECIDIDLTPNRGDCLSIRGLAREVAALNAVDYQAPEIHPVPAQTDAQLSVQLQAPEDCPRYVSRVIKGVDIQRPTPVWLREKLRRSGIRSKDIIVDITNYVLLELGQPMHAFDLQKIQGNIHVRTAQADESITLLDGSDIKLESGALLICDAEKPLALAGIMGGKDSAVSQTTQDILLEAAFFAPMRIAGRARSLGLHTDSSHRFERGVDYELPVTAMERATQLILGMAGGQPGPLVVAESASDLPQPRTIRLRHARIRSVLGMDMEKVQVESILSGLGFGLSCQESSEAELSWHVEVPSWRFDIELEVDLLEELARVYGYEQLPVRHLSMNSELPELDEQQRSARVIMQTLIQRGYQEVISYSFIPRKLQEQVDPAAVSIPVQNPISQDMAVMRSSLWPGLLQTLDYNLKRQQSRVRIFEQGLCFARGEGDSVQQQKRIGGLISGRRLPENWSHGREMVDFYDIKADVEALLCVGDYRYLSASHPALHPGQCARIVDAQEQFVGYVGALHPQLQRSWGFSVPVMLFELSDAAVKPCALPAFAPVSRYPEVRRDMALIVDRQLPAQALLDTVRQEAGDLLKDLILFDNYLGEGLESSQKSIAIGLIFGKFDTTLTDEEVNRSLAAIAQRLTDRHGAQLRD